MSPRLHLSPIYLVVFKGSYRFRMRYPILRGASRLDAFSVYPVPTWLPGHGVAPQPVHQWSVHPGPLVLRTAPLRYLTPAPDRDRPVSRRSEPSSRATLMGEQPNPWDLLQPQDVTSRHRGAKPPRRYELLGGISLLSPEYLLSFERRSFHTHPPDHYAPVSCLLGMSASQSSALMPLHSVRPVTNRPEGTFGSLRYAFGGDHPSQTTHQAVSAPQAR